MGLFSLSLAAQNNTPDLKLSIGDPNPINEKKRFLFNGVIKGENGAALEGINLLFPEINEGTVTNARGKFSIRLPYGKHQLRVEALGFKTLNVQLSLYGSNSYNFTLEEQAEALDEVVLLNRQNDNVESEMIGKSSLMADESKNIPLVLGEQNLLKAATILPGISSAGEASTGFNVRGGKADQNLILLNEAVIINPNHFFGVFQALNPFAINSLNVYKGNIPIEYEGRTSSVFELTTKNPSTKDFKGEVSVGPITANALLELPIKKERSGLMLGVRSAHSNWLLRSLKDPKLNKSEAAFYDAILTYEDQISEKDKLKATVYYSQDRFSITSDSLYQYANAMVAVNWKHQYDEKNSLNFVASHSNYAFSIRYDGGISNNFKSAFNLQVQALRLKRFKQLDEKHELTYGANLVNYGIAPGQIDPLFSTDLIRPEKLMDENALEGSLFFADRIRFSDRFLLNLGVQVALYGALGPYTNRSYQTNFPKNELTVTTIDEVPSNGLFGQKIHPNYRLAGRYKLNDNISVKFAALQIYQFIHSLTNNTTASPIDTWRISTNHLQPQQSNQFSFGVFSTSKNQSLELGLEGFYKLQDNLVDFKTGAQLFMNEFIETEVLQGKGKAYGIEFLLRKKEGKHTGWLGYTYSRSLIQLDSPFVVERVNNGRYFPTNYDKPHDFTLAWNFRLGKRVSLSTNMLYQTGRPITLPAGNYTFNQAEYVLFSDRNAFRIPDYYRMDVSLNYDHKKKQANAIGLSWNLSVYNILGRNNPFSVFFVADNGEIKGRQSSIFNVPIPSLNLSLKF
ncbi:MAG: TonB-dependent receptor [Flavobacteriaceae bacterium]